MIINPNLTDGSPCFATRDGTEILILDTRANARPAQMVEAKLVALLRSHAMPLSALRTAAHLAGTGFRGRLPIQSDR
jgi:hypothetical protein